MFLRRFKFHWRKITWLALYVLCFSASVKLLLPIDSFWMEKLSLTKNQANFWDIILKAVAGVATLIGVFITISRYLDEKEKENLSAMINAQAPFFLNVKKYIIY